MPCNPDRFPSRLVKTTGLPSPTPYASRPPQAITPTAALLQRLSAGTTPIPSANGRSRRRLLREQELELERAIAASAATRALTPASTEEFQLFLPFYRRPCRGACKWQGR